MQVVGVDIGGTSIKSALVEYTDVADGSSYKILSKSSTPTESWGGRDAVIHNIFKAVEKHIVDSDSMIIGVGSAGDVDGTTGIITYATDSLPGFTGLDLRKVLSDKFARRVIVVNDAVAALVGEVYTTDNLGERPMMLTLGTGLGCAMIDDARQPLGCGNVNFIRLGHIPLYQDGRTCACGLQGCAEQYVSATALKQNAGIEDVAEILSNPRYQNAVDKFIDDFRSVLLYALQKYAPSRIIVGGGVVELAKFWWEDLLAKCEKEVADKLVKAKLGNDAALIGSVYSALNGKFGLQNIKHN